MTSTRRCVAIGLLVVVAVAGCSGADPGTTTAAPTATQTTTAAPTATEIATATATPTETPTATPTTSPAKPGLDFDVRAVSECGDLCRDVTYAVVDADGEGATDVVAAINMTADGEPIWDGTERVGDVPAGGVVEETVRIEVGISEGYAVAQNNNSVTVTTELTADGRTTTIVSKRQF